MTAPFLNLKNVLGHEPTDCLPLNAAFSDPEAFGDRYAGWVRTTPFAHLLSFLDVTFFDLNQQAAQTIIIAPESGSGKAYDEVLDGFIGGKPSAGTDTLLVGDTIAGHQVFRHGLPILNKVGSQESIAPSVQEELDTYLIKDSGQKYRVVGERALHWVWPGNYCQEPQPIERARTSHAFWYYPRATYSETSNRLRTFIATVSSRPIETGWKNYVSRLCATNCRFLTTCHAPLAYVVAAPIGVWSGIPPRKFTQIGNIFLGLGGSEKEIDVAAPAFLRLLALHMYRANANLRGEVQGLREAGKAIGHEVKHLANAISESWIRPAGELFKIEPAQEPVGHGLIGRIQFSPEYPWVAEELAVVPFQRVLGGAGQLLRLWCLLDNPDDIPFAKDPSDTWTFEVFLGNCLEVARTMVLPHLLLKESTASVESLAHLRAIYNAIDQTFQCQQLQVDVAPELASVRLTYSTDTIWLARVFSTVFKNAVQHADPIVPMQVKIGVRNLKAINKYITVTISNRRRRDLASLIDLLAERCADRELARTAASYFQSASAAARTLEGEERVIFKTKEVVELCLRRIDGTLQSYSEPDADPYLVEFSCRISQEAVT